jgi:membrane protein
MRLAYFHVAIPWSEVAKRTVKEAIADDLTTLAAVLAYYFFFALFPALLFLLALASFFPVSDLSGNALAVLGQWAPGEVVQLFREQIREISEGNHGGLLTVGILVAVWSSSAAMVSLIDALNRAYDIEESRPWWKVRATAVALTVSLALFILVSFTLVLAGPRLADWVAAQVGFGGVFTWTWKVVQWPFAFLLVSTGIGLVYYFAPDAEQEWVWITPAAALATTLWLIVSLGFKIYVANFGTYNESYGTIGGVIVLLLWFYISGLAILLGAELAAEIEHASPHGKAPGEKVPGQRKKIGLAAAREFEARQRQQPPAPAPPGSDARPALPGVLAFHARQPMHTRSDERSLGELLGDLSRETRDLVQKEIQLAKTEISEKVTHVARHGALLAGGAALAYAGLLMVVGTLTLGLVAAGLPAWAAALIVTVVTLAAALVLVQTGLGGLKRTNVAPSRTMESLRDTADVLKERVK